VHYACQESSSAWSGSTEVFDCVAYFFQSHFRMGVEVQFGVYIYAEVFQNVFSGHYLAATVDGEFVM